MNGSHTTAAGGLPELVRPRFFPGQTLTDQNLTDLVAWVQARAELESLHEGWGVVCGLAVTSGQDADGKPVAVVSAGYAVDAAGNDLVVRGPLTKALPRVADPAAGRCAVVPPGEGKLTVGPFEGQRQSRWAVFDLLLCHATADAAFVAAPCGTVGRRCEPTRIREAAILEWVPRPWHELTEQPGNADRPGDPGVAFLKRAEGSLKDVFVLNGWEPPKADRVNEIRKWLTDQLRDDPALARTFPTLADWLAAHGGRELSTPWGVARVLFWMADAARRAARPCQRPAAGCRSSGVPLARVWAEAEGSYYAIRFVDDVPPPRRPFGTGEATGLDPRTHVGRPVRDARAELVRLGVTATEERFELPADGKHLLELYEAEPKLAPPPDKVTVRAAASAPTSAGASHLRPLAGRVIVFAGPGSGPLLKADTRLHVQLYPVGNATVPSTQFGPEPTGPQLAADALPSGGQVRLVIDPAKLDGKLDLQGDPTQHQFAYHDELQNRLFSLGKPQAGQFIVSAFQIPTGPRPDVRVTVALSLGDRLVAVTGLVGGDERPLPVQAFSFEDNLPVLGVAPYDAKTIDPPGRTAVLLQSPQNPELPVKVFLSNPGLTAISGKLHHTAAEPTKPDEGKTWMIRQELPAKEPTTAGTDPRASEAGEEKRRKSDPKPIASVDGQSGSLVPIPLPKVGERQWFWLTDGKDEFKQPFVIHHALQGDKFAPNHPDSGLTFEEKKLQVEVKNADASKAILTLTNKEGKPVALEDLRAGQLVKDGKLDPVDTAGKTPIAPDQAPSFDLKRQDAGSRWRVTVKFKIDNKDYSAAIDVAPTNPS